MFATAEEKREYLPILSCLTRSDPSYFHLEIISRTNQRRQWHPTPVLLPGKSHGQGSLVGCSPWGRYESDTTERLPFHFSLSCIGEGNGNPLQCSRLENPRDGGAWWASIYGVAQSRTRLKRLSSSSSRLVFFNVSKLLQYPSLLPGIPSTGPPLPSDFSSHCLWEVLSGIL